MLVMSLCLVSCGGDDDEDVNNGGSNGDNTEIKGDLYCNDIGKDCNAYS